MSQVLTAGAAPLRAMHVDVTSIPLITENSLDNNRTTHCNRIGRQRICQAAERIEDVNIAANAGAVALQSAIHAMKECIVHGSIVITFVFLVRTEEMFVGSVQVVDVSGRMCTLAYQLKHVTWYICQPFHVDSMVVPSVEFAFGTAVGAARHQIVDPLGLFGCPEQQAKCERRCLAADFPTSPYVHVLEVGAGSGGQYSFTAATSRLHKKHVRM